MFASIPFLNVLSKRVQPVAIASSVAQYSTDKKAVAIPDIGKRSVVLESFWSDLEKSKALNRIEDIAEGIIRKIREGGSSYVSDITWNELFFFKPFLEAYDINYGYVFEQNCSRYGTFYVYDTPGKLTRSKLFPLGEDKWSNEFDQRIQEAHKQREQELISLDNESTYQNRFPQYQASCRL